MSNTPKPQANILDETFEWLDKLSELNKLGGRGHGDLKDVCYICGISPNALKAQIQALITEEYRKGYTEGVIDNSINKDRLITEARINELMKTGLGGALESDEAMSYYKKRLAELKKCNKL